MRPILDVPIEVCEKIIDECAVLIREFKDLEIRYQTLSACALTGTRWLHRSRIHLYHTVWFKRSQTVDRFQYTLRTQPWLGSLVQVLMVGVALNKRQYIPFAHGLFVHCMPNLQHLELQVDLEAYPPIYRQFVRQFPIKSLSLENTVLTPSPTTLFALIWSLNELESCSITSIPDTKDSEAVYYRLSSLKERKPGACAKLRTLSIGHYGAAHKEARHHRWFPPRGAFGQSVQHFKMVYSNTFTKFEVAEFANLVACVSAFHSLQTLTIADHIYAQTEPEITASILDHFLSNVTARETFRHLHLELHFEYRDVSLHEFERFFSENVRVSLDRFRNFTEYTVDVFSNQEGLETSLMTAASTWMPSRQRHIKISVITDPSV